MFDVLADCGNISANGTLTVTGNVVLMVELLYLMKSGADLDARFEGNGDANLLCDAGNDRIGILKQVFTFN
jgi:hypothetical protein